MTEVLDIDDGALARWKTGPDARAVTTLLRHTPVTVRLERVHFPSRRPVQMTYCALLPSGASVPVLAEYCPDGTQVYADSVTASLMKSRNGQRAGLALPGIVADPCAGMVLRRPGLDERLPGLRLLHSPGAARETVSVLTGRDPGQVSVRLVAHRLGKRAVLRLSMQAGEIYARLRAVKSGDGADRLGRHRSLWDALGDDAALRVPKPLGASAELGVSLFGLLAGRTPDFETDARGIGQALTALRKLDLDGLPVHRAADEARILRDWLDRCRRHCPDLARDIAPRLLPFLERLSAHDAPFRPCHRDLHEKQILISGGVAGLLDFDTLSQADPALDPGNLLAHVFLADRPETQLRAALDRPGLNLWRRAALFRLAMIHAFTSMPTPRLKRLVSEALRDDRD